MRLFVAIDDAKGVFRARRQQEIVFAWRVVGYDFEHDIAAIGVERVSSSKVYSACVVERSAVADDLLGVMTVEGYKVGDLDALWINDGQALSLVQCKGGARARSDFDLVGHGVVVVVESDGAELLVCSSRLVLWKRADGASCQ